jgi:hypothetical protein
MGGVGGVVEEIIGAGIEQFLVSNCDLASQDHIIIRRDPLNGLSLAFWSMNLPVPESRLTQ